ncbi:MAG: response regulator, partial [Oceanidesulfovibrio sp.]
LGLSIVKRLVQLMGGSLTIESEPDAGTAIQFSVPFRIARTTQREEPPAKAPSRENMRLLVVEDEPINRMTLSKLMEHEGYTVLVAAGGKEALELLARERVDLVLMDIQMPVLDGLEVTRRIRRGDVPGLDPRIPIVALTAYAMAGDRKSFLQADMDDYLAKPVDVNDLRILLKRFSQQ